MPHHRPRWASQRGSLASAFAAIISGPFALIAGPAVAAPPPDSPMHSSSLACRLQVTELTPGTLGLAFQLDNPSASPITLHSFRPFMDVTLTIAIAGARIALIEPSSDMPVKPFDVVVPAHSQAALTTPIHLAFDPAVPPAGRGEPFTWHIRHARAPATLTATLNFGDVHVGPCHATFAPATTP